MTENTESEPPEAQPAAPCNAPVAQAAGVRVTGTELYGRAQAVLNELTGGSDAQFRDGQFEAISALVEQHRRALVVQRTGWGKSAVYFVAARLLRQAGAGPTLIVSPLLALMRDQIAAAERAGVRAVTINSANTALWDEIIAAIQENGVDVILISPERLTNQTFAERVLGTVFQRLGMIVVDEAHCISDWGHDFRPDYRRIGALLGQLNPHTPVLATTATANSRVVADVAEQLGHDTLVIRGSLTRETLRLGVAPRASATERIGWLAQHLGDFTGSGIIYTLTVAAAQDTTRVLKQAGWEVEAYTGATDPDERERLEQALHANELKALVATSALGMGFDKPDLGFVIHLGAPSSAVAYYQQVGRAGRSAAMADVLLLPGPEDPNIWEHFATAAMPDPDDAHTVLEALNGQGQFANAQPEAWSIPRLEPLVKSKRSRLELLLKTMLVEGAVERVSGGYRASGKEWKFDSARYAKVAQVRRAEAQAMLEYQKTRECRMVFLAHQLDDETATPCGRCDNCAGSWWDSDLSAQHTNAVAGVLNKAGIPVEPRGMWPSHMKNIGVDLSGKIPANRMVQTGRVIARTTDIGIGQTLNEFLHENTPDQGVPADIGQYCIEVLAQWDWAERPSVVVTVPQTHRPDTVQSLGRNLAAVGRLHYAGSPQLVAEPGSPQVNSAYRVKNLLGAFGVTEELTRAVRGHTVLLVDTEIQSRWTMTVLGSQLLAAGAKAVYPFALARRA